MTIRAIARFIRANTVYRSMRYLCHRRWGRNLVLGTSPLFGRKAVLDSMKTAMPDFHNDPGQAQDFMALSNSGRDENIRDIDPALTARAVEFNYLSWPRKILSHVWNKDLLDVGCGTGLHAVGYVVAGVKSYTGLDPKIDMTNDTGRNLRARQWQSFGWTPADITKQIGNVDYISGTFEEMAPELTYDIVVLHNVTEHLDNLEDVFRGIVGRLRPDGVLLYNHHNFYCWNGHHLMPKSIHDIDMDDPHQCTRIDWKHLERSYKDGNESYDGLNMIRLDDLKSLTRKYFQIETWKEVPSKAEQGSERFNDSIPARYPEYEKREFLVQHAFCVAKLR